MAVNFKGGFKVGGIQHHHPLDTEQIQFMLELLAATDFTGTDVQVVFTIAYSLQEEYKIVKKLEETTNTDVKQIKPIPSVKVRGKRKKKKK